MFTPKGNLELSAPIDVEAQDTPIPVETQRSSEMRREYWKYIARHPAHPSIMSLRDAHILAVTYLRWCSSAALLRPSSADVPFPYRHSQDLTGILESLSQQHKVLRTETLEAQTEPKGEMQTQVLQTETLPLTGAAQTELTTAQTHPHTQEIQSEPRAQTTQRPTTQPRTITTDELEVDYEACVGEIEDVPIPAGENLKLWTSVVAIVLTEKYAQASAARLNEQLQIEAMLPFTKLTEFMFRLLDIASFGSFRRYLGRLEELRKLLSSDEEWRHHILRLVKEWEEFNLISTVLLTASAGMLALENLGPVPRTAILISILASFGGITAGLYCISKYQTRSPESSDSIERPSNIIKMNYEHYAFTHKQTALALGLPMALLVWSLISFLVAILAFNIVDTKTNGHVSNVAYGVVAVAVVVLLFLFLAMHHVSMLWATKDNRLWVVIQKVQNAMVGRRRK